VMHLRKFCQVSIEDVMTRSPVKSSALDRKSEGRRLKIGSKWSYAPPVKNFWLRHCSTPSTKVILTFRTWTLLTAAYSNWVIGYQVFRTCMHMVLGLSIGLCVHYNSMKI